MGQYCSRRAVRSSSCQTDDVSDAESSTWEDIAFSFDPVQEPTFPAHSESGTYCCRTELPLFIIDLGAEERLTTCIVCSDNPKQGLFTHSWNLLGSILGTKSSAQEVYITYATVYDQLRNAGQHCCGLHVMLLSYNGRKALGAGYTKMQCQRAARLSLAALAYSDDHNWERLVVPDPTSDHAFQTLIKRVRRSRRMSSAQSSSITALLQS